MSMMRGVGPSRQARRPSSAAERPSNCSADRPSSCSPARFTSRSRWPPSKVKTPTSISTITVRRSAPASMAPSRWSWSVAASTLTSSITAPSGSSPLAPRARIEKSPSRSAASRFESVWSGRTTRWRTLKEQPLQTPTIEHRQRPLDLRREVAGPEQDQGDQGGGEAGGQREQQDALVEPQPGGVGQPGRRDFARLRHAGGFHRFHGLQWFHRFGLP